MRDRLNQIDVRFSMLTKTAFRVVTKYPVLFVLLCIFNIGVVAQNDSLDAMVDTLAGKQEMEFQQSVEEQATGDVATLRQFIKDSLQLVYDELLMQKKDSIATLFNDQITDILNQNSIETARLNRIIKSLQDSLAILKQPAPAAGVSSGVQYDPFLEDKYYHYEKMLRLQKAKSAGGFLSLSGEVENIHPFQVAELEKYIDRFFPEARCDSIQDFLTQIYIREHSWAKAELSIIKFIFLYPESPLFEDVKNIRANIFQTEKTYRDYADFLKTIVETTPAYPDIETRYFKFIEMLKEFPDPALKSRFNREARKYLELFPLSDNSPLVCLWLAEQYSNKQRPQSAFITYNRLMIFYPESPLMATALYRTAGIQETDFEEYDNAIETYYRFIEQFSGDTLVAYAHNRIAKIADRERKNWEKAVAEYQIAADLFFEAGKTDLSIAASMRKALILADEMNLIQDAVNSYLQVDERFPGTPAAHKALMAAGNLYREHKQFEAAITQYMTLYEKYPDAENVLNALDKCVDIYNSKLGDHDKTIETLDIIITNYPDSKSAKKAEKLLKKLQKS